MAINRKSWNSLVAIIWQQNFFYNFLQFINFSLHWPRSWDNVHWDIPGYPKKYFFPKIFYCIFGFLILFADWKSNLSPLNFHKNLSKIDFKVDPKFLRGTSFDKNFSMSLNFLSKDAPLKNFGSTLKSILDRFLWELRGLRLLLLSANKMGHPKMQ